MNIYVPSTTLQLSVNMKLNFQNLICKQVLTLVNLICKKGKVCNLVENEEG